MTLSPTNQPAIVLAALTLALAAIVAWLGHGAGSVAAYSLAAFLVLVAALIPRSLLMADQWEKAVVLRLGKLHAIRGPGLFFKAPFIDAVAVWLDQRIQTTEFNAEQALTADTVPANIDAILFWQVHDPEKAALEI